MSPTNVPTANNSKFYNKGYSLGYQPDVRYFVLKLLEFIEEIWGKVKVENLFPVALKVRFKKKKY